jgi:hypothetical protein
MTLTQERLRELLHYDPDTGQFTWRRSVGPMKAGSRAGKRHHIGYIRIAIERRTYMAHRLAWLYIHGVWPQGITDHINRDRADNRIANLREATYTLNMANTPIQKHNVSGFKGVVFRKDRKKWKASIRANGRYYYIGLFDTPEAAHDAYFAAAKRLFGDFARAA